MKVYNLLMVDDEPDKDIIDKLKSELMTEFGIELNYEIINPKNKEFENEDNDDFNSKHFYRSIKKYLRSTHVHLVACDYTLGAVDGIDVSHKIRHEFHFKGSSILFSTKIDALINDITVSNVMSENQKKDLLKRLVRSHITEFPSRGELKNVLKGYFVTPLGKLDLKQEILIWLNNFEAHKFKSVYPIFNDLTFAEIAEHIGDETEDGVTYCYEIIENAISLMIDLNNLPQR